ncbi:hypothetical protein [Cellulomonas fimi]|uniref:hypothetical protein n=1 Tax=Cellulomonas fimi TaxID=1708 RepID=UPI00235A367D|nr:hypothetical protein [Cellulomonas fimi]
MTAVLDAGATLALWEALDEVHPAARGAVVLVARGRVADLPDACAVPLRDAAAEALAELRARCGPVLATVLTCPGCGELLDVDLDLDALAGPGGPDVGPAAAASVAVPTPSGAVVVRAPTTSDVLAALADPDPARALRERCEAWPPGADRDEPAVRAAVERAADALAGVAASTVRTACPACGADAAAQLDVVALLAARVRDDARDLLVDVADLARAYGWSQDAILALSPARRATYLDLVRG